MLPPEESRQRNTTEGLPEAETLANRYSLLATNGDLQGIYSILEPYVEKSTSVVRLPLPPQLKRWFEPVENLLADVVATAAWRTKRPCIADTRTRETCLEVGLDVSRQNLFIHADRDPSSRPSLAWTYCEANVRGFFF